MLERSTALLDLLAAETCSGSPSASNERSNVLIHEVDIVSFMVVICCAELVTSGTGTDNQVGGEALTLLRI